MAFNKLLGCVPSWSVDTHYKWPECSYMASDLYADVLIVLDNVDRSRALLWMIRLFSQNLLWPWLDFDIGNHRQAYAQNFYDGAMPAIRLYMRTEAYMYAVRVSYDPDFKPDRNWLLSSILMQRIHQIRGRMTWSFADCLREGCLNLVILLDGDDREWSILPAGTRVLYPLP